MNDNVFKLLELYYGEWKFRQENMWRQGARFSIVIFFVSTFPISIDFF